MRLERITYIISGLSEFARASGVYEKLKQGMDKPPMGLLSILFICAAYILTTFQLSLPLSLIILPLGTIYASEFENPRFGLLVRSSTDANDNSAPRDHQQEYLESEVERVDGSVEFVVNTVESAATMDRESLKQFTRAARRDKIDIMGAMDVDRITRSDIYDAHTYYNELRNLDCNLFAGSVGYVDWEDLNDRHNLLNQTVFARQWYLRLKEGADGSIEQELAKGKYPRGTTPFGFETDSEHEIWVRDEAREIMYRAFEIYTNVKNRSKTLDRINNKRRAQGKETLSDSNLRTLLESRLCVGQLANKGNVVSTKPGLQVVDLETFKRTQRILRSRRKGEDWPDYPDFMSRALDRYEIDFLRSIFDSLSWCRKCGGELDPTGGDQLMGLYVQEYECQNCNHQGPLLTEKEIQEIHQTAPLSCPYCQSVERFSVTEAHVPQRYRYTCEMCGGSFDSEKDPNKIKRGFEDPVTMFDIDQSLAEKLEAKYESDQPDAKETAKQETLLDFAGS